MQARVASEYNTFQVAAAVVLRIFRDRIFHAIRLTVRKGYRLRRPLHIGQIHIQVARVRVVFA